MFDTIKSLLYNISPIVKSIKHGRFVPAAGRGTGSRGYGEALTC